MRIPLLRNRGTPVILKESISGGNRNEKEFGPEGADPGRYRASLLRFPGLSCRGGAGRGCPCAGRRHAVHLRRQPHRHERMASGCGHTAQYAFGEQRRRGKYHGGCAEAFRQRCSSQGSGYCPDRLRYQRFCSGKRVSLQTSSGKIWRP